MFDGQAWSTEYPCVRELRVLVKKQQVRVSAVRVSICSELRPDICSEEKYSSSGIVPLRSCFYIQLPPPSFSIFLDTPFRFF